MTESAYPGISQPEVAPESRVIPYRPHLARLCAGPDGANIGNKRVALSTSGPNHLVILYNVAANSVSAWVNNVAICKDGAVSPVPIKADYAGFACYGVLPDTKMDNFKMTVQDGAGPPNP